MLANTTKVEGKSTSILGSSKQLDRAKVGMESTRDSITLFRPIRTHQAGYIRDLQHHNTGILAKYFGLANNCGRFGRVPCDIADLDNRTELASKLNRYRNKGNTSIRKSR